MVRRTAFDRGDIVWVSLDHSVGRELQGELRPALVLSTRAFNALVGTALVAPISQGGAMARIAGFTVSLTGSGTETQGVILLSAVRMLDLERRGARKVESAPDAIVDEALARLASIIE